jgi:hypothetical protein
MSVYNEEELIGDAIRSLIKVCDQIIVVDGAYEGFPLINGSHRSTDYTLKIAGNLGCKIIRAGEKLWKSQVQKRNAYMIFDGWGIMLDADERVDFADDFSIPDNYPAYNVEMFDLKRNSKQEWLRVFKRGRYVGAHNIIKYKGKILIPQEYPLLNNIRMTHHRDLRSEERKLSCAEYYSYQFKKEKKFRDKVGIG